MKWSLLFLAACGGSTEGLLNLGEASAPETSVNADGSREALAETSTTDAISSTDTSAERGVSDASTDPDVSPLDTSTKPITDAGSKDSDASVDCNLTCEPMCERLATPMRACCAHDGCHCAELDAGRVCEP